MSSCAVVIVNYNTCGLLRACLESVSTHGAASIIVVDNGSNDGSTEMVRAQFPHVQLVETQQNNGYGAAANTGIRVSSAPYVLLLNSDILLKAGALTALTNCMERSPKVGIAGPRLLNPDSTLQPSCFPFPSLLDIFLDTTHLGQMARLIPFLGGLYLRTWNHTHERRVPWLSGAALMIRRAAFDQVGGFDERFFMYYEETDLCRRMGKAGWQTHFSPAAEIIHLGGGSTQKIRAAMMVQFYQSLDFYYQRHYSRVSRILLSGLVYTIGAARLARDSVQIRTASQAEDKKRLREQQTAWADLITGAWQRETPHG
jgi:GT2 family glycosyltransferase